MLFLTQANYYGNFGTTITAYDNTNAVIGSVSITATSSGNPDTALPIGATSSTPISKVVIGLDFASSSPDDFAFGTFYFTSSAVGSARYVGPSP